MIKEPTEKQFKNVTINVYLSDGREFLGCDITSKPTGEKERVVAFWYEGNVHMFPMAQVREVVLVFPK